MLKYIKINVRELILIYLGLHAEIASNRRLGTDCSYIWVCMLKWLKINIWELIVTVWPCKAEIARNRRLQADFSCI